MIKKNYTTHYRLYYSNLFKKIKFDLFILKAFKNNLILYYITKYDTNPKNRKSIRRP